MKVQCYTGLLATTLSLFVIGAHAQTGTLSDLGSLLASQRNLTTYYSLIQVSSAI
jgi:transforming growth factor-beta-induced protein